jgi:hypothetical protein
VNVERLISANKKKHLETGAAALSAAVGILNI